LLVWLDVSLTYDHDPIRYDHQERLTAQEAMAHLYFAPVRQQAASESAEVVHAKVIDDDAGASSEGGPDHP